MADGESKEAGGLQGGTRLKTCRMYEQEFPELETCIMVQVKSIAEMGAYVSLLEYNGIEGMILLSELSRRRIRSINKLIRVGKNEVVMAIRVDKEKGYIDLSKRRASPEEVAQCEERYNKSKQVHSVMRHVAEKHGIDMEDVYIRVGWPLYKKFGHAFDGLKLALTDPDSVFEGLDIPAAQMSSLLTIVKRKLTPQPLKIRADVEVTCFTSEGVEAIRYALMEGENIGTEEMPIKIKLIAPPLYVMLTTSLEKDPGIAQLDQCLEFVKGKIEARGGQLTVKVQPRMTSQREELELDQLIEKFAVENMEKDGDDDDE